MKQKIYRVKRLYQNIIYLRKHFYNWDTIIKRAINGQHTSELKLRNGLSFFNANNNTLHIYKEVFASKVYTNSIIDIFENDVVFDIGANVGVFSIFAAMTKGVRVFSFEPDQNNYRILKNNISKNNLNNIKSYDYAVGAKTEKRLLKLATIFGGHTVAKKDETHLENSTLSIEMKSIVDIINELEIKQIDFLKMDCEGAEGEIIKALIPDKIRNIQKIAMEFHDDTSELKHEDIISILKSNGFITQLVWDGNSNFGYIYAKRK